MSDEILRFKPGEVAKLFAAEKKTLTELQIMEQRAWQETLGATVEVKPLPGYLTPEIRRNLERLGMEFRYIPALELGSKDDINPETRPTPGGFLRRGGEETVGAEESYLQGLESKYPNWHRYEGMSAGDKDKHEIPRNLNEWFWQQVKDGNIDFPNLPGQWVAVETMDKPPYGDRYPATPLTAKMGLEDRFNVILYGTRAKIDGIKTDLWRDAGLRPGVPAHVQMLDALSWNLLANREGWGQTDTYEWTNTEFRGDYGPSRVVVGSSVRGGAAHAGWDLTIRRDGRLGFRIGIFFGE